MPAWVRQAAVFAIAAASIHQRRREDRDNQATHARQYLETMVAADGFEPPTKGL